VAILDGLAIPTMALKDGTFGRLLNKANDGALMVALMTAALLLAGNQIEVYSQCLMRGMRI
jgi:hypothetical protein